MRYPYPARVRVGHLGSLATAMASLLLFAACGSSAAPTGDNSNGTSAASNDAAVTTAAAAAATVVTGTALPTFRAGSVEDPAVGLTAPQISGSDLLTGEPLEIAATDQPLVVSFYAHWCPHCQAEVASLTDWLADNSLPAGVDFAAVSVFEDASRGNHPPSDWLASEGWSYPVVADNQDHQVASAFGFESIPFLVAIDADGKVAARVAGSVPPERLREFFLILAAAQ